MNGVPQIISPSRIYGGVPWKQKKNIKTPLDDNQTQSYRKRNHFTSSYLCLSGAFCDFHKLDLIIIDIP